MPAVLSCASSNRSHRIVRQDWEELLEANIKAGYSASNTAHLNAIKLTAKNLEDILQQQVRPLIQCPWWPLSAAPAADPISCNIN